ncbi:MAG: hypothetical protein NC212_06115 [Staphylococcus sp.]|nr:hypothetical protein [Staphylococcus sp.]
MFAIVGAFEIAIRNAIDKAMISNYGSDWLRDAVLPGGFFDVPQCRSHSQIIHFAYNKLANKQIYTHSHLLAKMEFGIWKYMFSSPQYRASGRILLRIFPNKPTSTRHIQYNNTTIFNELDHVNSLRNRIAHHEPICFPTGKSEITTDYIEWIYAKIEMLLNWMGINPTDYLQNLSEFVSSKNEINNLKEDN